MMGRETFPSDRMLKKLVSVIGRLRFRLRLRLRWTVRSSLNLDLDLSLLC